MEQRRDARSQIDQSAWVTIYGTVDRRIPAQVRNISGRGIGLEVDEPVEPGSALKIETGDLMMLGEAIYCSDEGVTWYIGIELDQAVHGLKALCNSLSEFAPAESRGEQAYAVQETDRQH